MSTKHRKGVLYIRRMKPQDRADSWITAVSMAAKQMLAEKYGRRPPLVLLRHGFHDMTVIEVGETRRDLQQRILSSHPSFKATARSWRV